MRRGTTYFGVYNWLKKKGYSHRGSEFIIKRYSKEVGFKFNDISRYNKKQSKEFQEFVKWFSNQSIRELKKEYRELLEKSKQKKVEKTEKFKKSDFFKLVLKTSLEKNEFRKKYFPKMSWQTFKSKWKVAKNIINGTN